MKFIIKSCTTNPGGGIPDWWCKIPFWRCSQLQVQEIVFMADRNLEARRRRRRRRLSICQMMAMSRGDQGGKLVGGAAVVDSLHFVVCLAGSQRAPMGKTRLVCLTRFQVWPWLCHFPWIGSAWLHADPQPRGNRTGQRACSALIC